MRVAHYTNNWGSGGVVNYIVSLIQDTCREVDYDIVTLTEDKASRDADLALVGIERTVLAKEQHHTATSVMRNLKTLTAYFKTTYFDIVHIHGNNAAVFLVARAVEQAYGGNQPSIIIHSHNSACSSLPKTGMSMLLRALFNKPRYHRWACSHSAGKHLFGRKKFCLIPNGIPTSVFRFSPQKRRDIRERFGLSEENFVIGFVGNFQDAKNPLRALKIFQSIAERDTSARLLFVGDGSKKDAMLAYLEESALEKRCSFAGRVANVQDYYSAFDIMLLPSLYEGFPLVAVEAQASGLYVAASASIDAAIEITPLVKRMPLGLSDEKWAETICRLKDTPPKAGNREDYNVIIQQSKYDRKTSAQGVIECYRSYLAKLTKASQ